MTIMNDTKKTQTRDILEGEDWSILEIKKTSEGSLKEEEIVLTTISLFGFKPNTYRANYYF